MPGLYAEEDDFPVARELGYASWLNRAMTAKMKLHCSQIFPADLRKAGAHAKSKSLTTPRSSMFLSEFSPSFPPVFWEVFGETAGDFLEEIQFRQRLRGSDVGCHVPHAAESDQMSPLAALVRCARVGVPKRRKSRGKITPP